MKEFMKYIDHTGKFNFKGVPQEVFIAAFKRIELFPANKTLSEHTIKEYNRDLNDFLDFLKRENIDLAHMNVIVLQEYDSMLSATLAARSAKRKLSVLKRLLKFGYNYGYYAYVMENEIKYPTVSKYHYSEEGDKKEIREMDLATAQLLIKGLAECVKTKAEPLASLLRARNELLGYFLLTTGMRASEIVNLNWNSIKVEKDKYSVTFKGKGSKTRTIPLQENVVEKLKRFRVLDKLTGPMEEDDSPIFKGYKKSYGRLSYRSLHNLVKLAGEYVTTEVIRINPNISPHWFRHTFITTALEQNIPLVVVKELAGHADVSTTNLYIERINNDVLHTEVSKLEFGV